ncbi:hypothetical protein [Aquimarina sp. 2201CG14-23]|uniref:hypothetical protein n=1 Tax=Aquimarina mycalae TaxID=3040073 RepID=UPI002478184B|nr:hypothetical protein [Aquimarina sp. 2201CG14-23]MDH7447604.1 hypothetical protein [Aquimarina sp. 2201CG14-23]
MKINNPIHIHLKDFFLKEQFDIIKVGQTKEWILNNFPEPDDDTDMGNGFSIIRYGWIELHFDLDKLFLIWCDSLPYIEDSDRIKYDKWMLTNLDELTLEQTQKRLNSESVNYLVKFNTEERHVIVKIKYSGVKLWFHPETEKMNDETNKYKLFAFGKSEEDYDNFNRGF